MNIKCPFCGLEFESNEENHIFYKHDDEDISNYLLSLLSKIYEKIAELDKEDNPTAVYDQTPLYEKRELLKSLLENKK